MRTEKIANWNSYPKIKADIYSLKNDNVVIDLLDKKKNLISRGNGKSYGDASLGENIVSSLDYNRFLEFDVDKGLLTVQSGIQLSEILEIIIPRGWFLPVTPGTKYITIGGAVGADVHGKNHHIEGSISRHIQYLEILLSDGKIIRCSPDENSDLFHGTCGGMGLTGLILTVCLKLKRIETSKITQRQIKASSLQQLLDYLEQYNRYTYSVAWIDCLSRGKNFGRGILNLGEHTKKVEREYPKDFNVINGEHLNIPFDFPGITLNKWSIKAFNELYYQKNLKKNKNSIDDYHGFFYPLDFVNNWNRIYGSRGFLQYQFVIPLEKGREGLQKILKMITDKGWGSFLAVLKIFGDQDEGIISFPMKGYTLALDFPIRKGLFDFLNEVDRIVMEYGGRLYLAKDARMSEEMFKNSYPEYIDLIAAIYKYNSKTLFKSALSKRLKIE